MVLLHRFWFIVFFHYYYYYYYSGWWETKHSQAPDISQVINTVQNSTSGTGKCFLLLFKVTPDADVLSIQRK